jgi:hypothetical protein
MCTTCLVLGSAVLTWRNFWIRVPPSLPSTFPCYTNMSDYDAVHAELEARRKRREEEDRKWAEDERTLKIRLAAAEEMGREQKRAETKARIERIRKDAADKAEREARDELDKEEARQKAQAESDEARASQLDIDMGAQDSEEVEIVETKKAGKKRKGEVKTEGTKKTGEWTIVGGAGRCEACIREDTPCKINVGAIDTWREKVGKGEVFTRGPAGTNCEQCANIRRKRCVLPATEDMRALLVEVPKAPRTPRTLATTSMPRPSRATTRSRGGSSAPSIASSSKRKWTQVEVEVPPAPKRLKLGGMPPMTQDGFFAALMGLLERSEQRAAESSRAAATREEELGRVMRLVATNLALQTKVLGRLERKLIAGSKGKEKADDEDVDEELARAEEEYEEGVREEREVFEAAEVIEVPRIELSEVESQEETEESEESEEFEGSDRGEQEDEGED